MANRNDKKERFYCRNRDPNEYALIKADMFADMGKRYQIIQRMKQQYLLDFCTDFEYACKEVELLGKLSCETDVDFRELGRYRGRRYSLRELLGGSMEKHKIDWMRVPVNTQLQIRGTGDTRWKNRYFAFCKDGTPHVFCGGATSWSAKDGWDSTFPLDQWTECRFADEEMEKKYWKD